MLECDIMKNKCKTRKLKKLKKQKNKTKKNMNKLFKTTKTNKTNKTNKISIKSYSPTINRGDVTIKDSNNIFDKCGWVVILKIINTDVICEMIITCIV